MYKKYGVLVILLILMAIPVTAMITGYQTGPPPPVSLSPGWNFVGFPISISRAELGQVAVFEFRNNKWQRFEGQKLEQFKGYFVEAAQSKSVAYTLPATNPQISLTQGWNALSVSKEVKIKDARFKGKVIHIIEQKPRFYAYTGTWVELNTETTLTHGKGYLVYAQEAGELSYVVDSISPEIAQLIAQLKSNNKQVKLRAIEVLGTKGPAAKDAVPALINALKDTNHIVRSSAARALGNIGPDARDAVTELNKLKTTDPESSVRQIAAEALQKIQK